MIRFLNKIVGGGRSSHQYTLSVKRDQVLARFYDLESHGPITCMRAAANRSTMRMISTLEAEGVLCQDLKIPGAITPTRDGVNLARRAAIRVRALENMRLREEAHLNTQKIRVRETDFDEPMIG